MKSIPQQLPIAPSPITVIIKKSEGNKFMQDIVMEGNSVQKQVINGNKGYVSGMGGRQDLSAEDLADSKEDLMLFVETYLLTQPDLVVEAIETIDGKDAYVLKAGKNKYYYDVETGFKVAESTEQEQMGQKFTTMNYYKDYKEVKGVKLPHNMIQNIGFELDITFSEVKINEGVADEDFK